MARSSRRNINGILAEVANEIGVSLHALRAFIGIESNFNPKARTGSYKGLGQLSDNEFRRWGKGSIWNPRDNAKATAKIMQANSAYFQQQFGREPSAADLYLMHQQGRGGYAQHLANPDRPAWESMYATAEGRGKGEGWSKRAIWGNLPSSEKQRFGNVDSITSRDFINYWTQNINRKIEGSPPEYGTPIPEQGIRTPERRSQALSTIAPGQLPDMSGIEQLPTQRTIDFPSRRTELGAKYQYRAPEYEPDIRSFAQTPTGIGQPGISGSPGANMDLSVGQAQGFTPELTTKAFGEPFGELFANSKGVPTPPPLFSDLFDENKKVRIGAGSFGKGFGSGFGPPSSLLNFFSRFN